MFFNDDPEFTDHGYYLVNGIKTLSKFEAWQFSKGNFNDIQFIYNDELMSSYDWTVEPTKDIYELYADRARQIRHKYDYIVLMYSGGIDSHTILETFLENNIRIDEICTLSNTNVEPITGKFNQEVFNRAVPFVNSLNLSALGTKFRLVDISRLVIEQYADEFHFENHHYYFNGSVTNWTNTARSHVLKSHVTDHLKLTEQGKKVCYVWGFDKPFINVINGSHCLQFPDASIDFNIRQYINRVALQHKFANFYDEQFFISIDCPEISIKQAHMLLNAIKQIPVTDERLVGQDDLPNTGPFVVHHREQYYRFLTKKMVDGIIYPKAILAMFKNDKMKGSVMLTSRDDWFNKSNHDNQTRWSQNLINLVNNNTGFYKFKDNKLITTNHILSKPYFLEKDKS
jgi:hypothetical protein